MNQYYITLHFGEYDNLAQFARFFVPRGVTYGKLRRVLTTHMRRQSGGLYRNKLDWLNDVLELTAMECYGRYELVQPDDEFDLSKVLVGG